MNLKTRLRQAKVLGLIAAAHFVTVVLGFFLTGFHGAPAIWPAAGLAFGLAFSFGRTAVIAVFIGTFTANLCFGIPFVLATLFGSGSALEAALGALLIRLMLRRTNEYIFHQESVGVVLASILAPILPALFSVTGMCLGGLSDWPAFGDHFVTWWAADLLGGLVWAPLALWGCRMWYRGKPALEKLWRRELWRSLPAWVFLIPVCAFIFGTDAGRPLSILVFPVMLIAAWFGGEFGVKVAATLVSLYAVMSTQHGLGPFVWVSEHENLRSLQLFLMTVGLTSMALGIFTRMRLSVAVAAILLVGWFVSGAIFHSFFKVREDRDHAHLVTLVTDAEGALRSNLHSLENSLRNATGLFAVKKDLQPSQWMDYVEALGLLKNNSALDGFGVAFRVPFARIGAYERQQRRQGRPDFQAHAFPQSHLPISERVENQSEALLIGMVGGRDTPSSILGLDLGSEKKRRAAAERARDTGEVAVSGTIRILGDDGHRPGFMILAPLYRPNEPHATLEERRKSIFAWVYSPVVYQKLLGPLVANEARELDFFIFDSTDTLPENLVFGTRGFDADAKAAIAADKYLIRPFAFGQHVYTIAWTRGAAFLSLQDDTLAWIGTLGALLALAAALMYLYMQTFKQRAEALVEQKTLELSARERLWRTLTEAAPVGIFQSDAQGSYTYVNPKWCELTMLRPHQAFGDGWLNAIHPDDYRAVRLRWEECVNEGRVFSMEYRFLHPQGERWVSALATRILAENQRTTGFVGIELDITERKVQEGLVERERIKAMESSKMASLGEMAGGIAHEINNPLAIIVARAHQVKQIAETSGDTKKIAEFSEKIETTANRIAKIIRGLRAFSRNSDNDPMIPAAIGPIIEDSLELCRERFRTHGVDLSVQGEGGAEILCRPSQISQVLLNLLNNSYDAVCGTPNPWVRIEIELKNQFLEISVTDSGKGIPREVALKMMDPFFTTKEVGKGTGLGLSISRGIIEEHAGRLWLDQDFIHTRFVIRVPLAAQNEQSVA